MKLVFGRFLIARSVSPLRFRFGWILETKGTTEFLSNIRNLMISPLDFHFVQTLDVMIGGFHLSFEDNIIVIAFSVVMYIFIASIIIKVTVEVIITI